MTNYYVYNDDGKQETRDERPTSGFYYEQDHIGGEVTLCEIDPQTGDRVVVETFEAGEAEYLVTEGGQAYEKTSHDKWDWSRLQDVTVFEADTSERRVEDDPESAIEHFGIETFGDGYGEYAAKDSKDIYAYNEETGKYEAADYSEFELKVWVPKGTGGVDPSPILVDKINAANFYLGWLSRQMGTGDINKPEYLIDSEGKKKDLDEYLDAAFFNEIAASGATADSEVTTATELADLVEDGELIDEKFGAKVLEIDRNNHEKYAELFNKVSAINEAMVHSLMGKYSFEADSIDRSGVNNLKGSYGGALTTEESEAEEQHNKDHDDIDLADPGIQNIVEELELYEILARGMADCTTIVDQYAEQMEALAEEHPDQKHKVDDGKWHEGNDPLSEKPDDGGGDDGDNGDDGDGNNGDGNNGGNNGGGNNGGGNNGGNNGGDSEFDSGSDTDAGADTDSDTEPSADPDAELAALGEDFSNILGGSESTPEGSATEDLLGGGEEDKSSSLEDRVMEYINGDTGNTAGGATQAMQPQQPQATPDMSSLAMMPLLSSLTGQGGGLLGGGEKDGDKGKDDEPRGRDQNRPIPGPPQQSPGVAVTTDPGIATAQHAVTASPDAGPPPVVSTPGATTGWTPPGGEPGKDDIPVPQAVGDALTRQMGNPAMDAATAYAGTPGEQTVQNLWDPIDVSALKTGDVIAWENHSAVVVDNGNGPHYLENGKLVPLNQNGLDHPQYGKFQNYFHPAGLDSAGGTNMQIPEAPTEMPEPKITASQPPEPPPIQGPEQT
ncbi:hypothetical protein [Nocardia carnea]|uniref:hypothetical protein n=1 Tax=Nocardia carnea TaxID=37328 RepID=UPI0024538D50|nr:hypothetical protein [Nocardia carnea]